MSLLFSYLSFKKFIISESEWFVNNICPLGPNRLFNDFFSRGEKSTSLWWNLMIKNFKKTFPKNFLRYTIKAEIQLIISFIK